MHVLVLGIVYEQNSIVNSLRVDDWTAKWVIIFGNEHYSFTPGNNHNENFLKCRKWSATEQVLTTT